MNELPDFSASLLLPVFDRSCPSKSEMVSYCSLDLLVVNDVKHLIYQGSFLHPRLMREQIGKEVLATFFYFIGYY